MNTGRYNSWEDNAEDLWTTAAYELADQNEWDMMIPNPGNPGNPQEDADDDIDNNNIISMDLVVALPPVPMDIPSSHFCKELAEQNGECDMMIPNPGNPQEADDIKINNNIMAAPPPPTPRPMDIIFGRGTGNHYHQGNMLLRKRVATRLEHHSNLTKSGKSQLIRDLIGDLRSEGVRFLKKKKKKKKGRSSSSSNDQSCCWHIVDEPKILHNKLSHCFRTLKKTRGTAIPRL